MPFMDGSYDKPPKKPRKTKPPKMLPPTKNIGGQIASGGRRPATPGSKPRKPQAWRAW